MKKLMAFLAMVLVVTPFVNVKAETFATYKPAEQANFYMYTGDEVGSAAIILKDEGESSQYVKVWLIGAVVTDYYKDSLGDMIRKSLKNGIEAKLSGADLVEQEGGAAKIDMITLDDLIEAFDATANSAGDEYTIDAEKYGALFNQIQSSSNKIWTGTEEGEDVWVIDLTYDNPTDTVNRKVTAIKVVKEKSNSDVNTEQHAGVPVVYADKTQDCKNQGPDKTYACYVCEGSEDYSWLEKGTQGDTCQVVDGIETKSKCVKAPQTGVEDYIVEFAAVAGICLVGLLVIKRKEIFKGI